MNFKINLIITAVIFMLIGSACSGQGSLPNSSAAGSGSTSSSTGAATQPASSPAGTAGTVSYSKDVLPIFQNACINCHGGEKISRGLDMKTFDSLMVGSQFGAVIVPGDATGSKLIQSVQSGKMPKRGPKLTPDQIQLLVEWVNAGALNN